MIPGFMSSMMMSGSGPDMLFLDTQVSATISGTSRPFTSVSLGNPSSDRFILVVLGGGDGFLPTSITIGGVTAPRIYNASNSLNFYGAVVPSGTTGAIACTLTSSSTASVACLIYRPVGLASNTVVASGTITSGGGAALPQSVSGTLNGSGAGIYLIVAGAFMVTVSSSVTSMTSLTPVGGDGPFYYRTVGLYGVVGLNGTAAIAASSTIASGSGGNGSTRLGIVGFAV